GGGRLIYPGGNGIYERTQFTPDGNALIFSDYGNRDYFSNHGESPTQVIGVDLSPDYMDFYPYQVANDHPLLAGTGLSVGDTFGATAYDGAASGWEVDVMPDGGLPNATLIAKGQNPNDGGADMIFLDNGNGG